MPRQEKSATTPAPLAERHLLSVTVQNRQSHKHTDLPLGPGVNFIVGTSDGGKSALLRSVRWAAENQPPGDADRSWWGGDTSVVLHFADGTEVRRLRTNSKNQYAVGETTLEGFGQTVPAAVREAVDFGEHALQAQHDRPFLLSDSPAEVARALNRVAHLEDIDAAMAGADALMRRCHEDQRAVANALASAEARAAELDWTMEAAAALQLAMEKDAIADATENRLAALRDEYAVAVAAERTVERTSWAKTAFVDVAALQHDVSAADSFEEARSYLAGMIEDLRVCSARVASAESVLAADALVAAAEKAEAEAAAAQDAQAAFYGALYAARHADSVTAATARELVTAEEAWAEEAPDACPLCGGTGKLKGGAA